MELVERTGSPIPDWISETEENKITGEPNIVQETAGIENGVWPKLRKSLVRYLNTLVGEPMAKPDSSDEYDYWSCCW